MRRRVGAHEDAHARACACTRVPAVSNRFVPVVFQLAHVCTAMRLGVLASLCIHIAGVGVFTKFPGAKAGQACCSKAAQAFEKFSWVCHRGHTIHCYAICLKRKSV